MADTDDCRQKTIMITCVAQGSGSMSHMDRKTRKEKDGCILISQRKNQPGLSTGYGGGGKKDERNGHGCISSTDQKWVSDKHSCIKLQFDPLSIKGRSVGEKKSVLFTPDIGGKKGA